MDISFGHAKEMDIILTASHYPASTDIGQTHAKK
jgi:hypothetical protein